MSKNILFTISIYLILIIIVGLYCKMLFFEDKPTEVANHSQSNSNQPLATNKIIDDNRSSLTPETAKDPYYAFDPDTKEEVIIANKKHALPKSYNPGVNVEALNAVNQLIADAQKSNDPYASKIVYDTSNFRSYDYQVALYNEYEVQDGEKSTNRYSSKPGYSEHQTGLAFDLMASGYLYRYNDSEYDYKTDWLYLNAYKYGFIVRYLAKDENVTGYEGEPWHLRYLGKKLAKKVFDSNKTLEEYLHVEAGDYSGQKP